MAARQQYGKRAKTHASTLNAHLNAEIAIPDTRAEANTHMHKTASMVVMMLMMVKTLMTALTLTMTMAIPRFKIKVTIAVLQIITSMTHYFVNSSQQYS